MGGVFRALRHELGLPMEYGMSSADYTVLSRREAWVLTRVCLVAQTCIAAVYARVGLSR